MCKRGERANVIIDGAVVEVDECMVGIIWALNRVPTVKTLGCCCGHGKYPTTVMVIVEGVNDGKPFEIMSMTPIDRKRKFYKFDETGMYHIPEVVN